MRNFSANILLLIVGIMLCTPAISQQQDEKEMQVAQEKARELMQEASLALGENNFAKAEAAYRKAIAKDPENSAARYNMGNMYYTRDNSVQAGQRYKQAAEVAETKTLKHRANHNLGNAFMKQKKYQEAIDAYKDALRNDPTDDETRYNLALAKKMLEEQKKNQDNKGGGDDENQDQKNQDKENQEEQNQDQNKDQENKDNQDQQDQGDKSEEAGDKDQQNKDQEEKEGDQDEKKQPGDQNEQEKNEPQPKQGQPQPAQGQLSPEQVKSLLEAMNNEERKVQDKINAKKQKGAKVQSEKDW